MVEIIDIIKETGNGKDSHDYEGVYYDISADLSDFGFGDNFAVTGSESILQAVISISYALPDNDTSIFSWSENKSQPIQPDVEYTSYSVAFTLLFAIVLLVGLVGNFLLAFTILILQEYKTVLTHWYVLQLAFADMIFLLSIPFRVAEELQNGWSLPSWICKARETMLFLAYYASICFLLLMTIDRYIHICYRRSKRLLHKSEKWPITYAATVVIWIVSLLLCTPVMMFTSVVGTTSNCKCETSAIYGCDAKKTPLIETETNAPLPSHNQNQSAMVNGLRYFNFVGMFIVPFTVMGMCFVLITLKLRTKRMKNQSEEEALQQNSPRTPDGAKENRPRAICNCNSLMPLCALMSLVFLACWLPFEAFYFAGLHSQVAFSVAYLLISFQTATNPFLYNFVGIKSQTRLKSALSSATSLLRRRQSKLRFQNSGEELRLSP